MNQTPTPINTYRYPYGTATSGLYSIGFPVIALFGAYGLFPYAKSGDFTWLVFIVPLFFLSIGLWVLVKKLFPALRGDIALEINSLGIVSYDEDVTIEWSDIKSIDYDSGGTSPSLTINFKQETDHGNRIRIKLLYVAGDGQDIYETAMSLFRGR